MDKFYLALAGASGVVGGVVVALKVIAPKTKSKADDKVLAKLEALEALLRKLQ